MKNTIVPKGGAAISNKKEMTIEAACLGACLAVCISDPVAGISAVTVPLLPVMTGLNTPAGEEMPLDMSSGLKKIFQNIMDAGGTRGNLHIWLAGAGRFMEEPAELALGVQLYSFARKILQKNGLNIHAEHVGGHFDRSVRLEAGADVLNVILPDGREVII